MSTLVIYIKADMADMSLACFPFGEDQYIESELVNDVEEMTTVYVPLGDADDTTVAQEQFLNTSESVMSYRVYP